jgi:hypothetical protein
MERRGTVFLRSFLRMNATCGAESYRSIEKAYNDLRLVCGRGGEELIVFGTHRGSVEKAVYVVAGLLVLTKSLRPEKLA